MHLRPQLPLILSILASAAAAGDPSSLASTSSSFLARHLERAHGAAIRHSAGLARDLRLAFRGVLHERRDGGAAQQQPQVLTGQKPFCVSGPRSTSPASGGPASASSARPTSTKGASTSKGATATPTGGAPSPTQTSAWKLFQNYTGQAFFDDWDFFTGADPTNGIVTYIDKATSQSSGLAKINSAGNLVMAVETTGTVSNTRQSVRITTQATFNGGIVVLDALHMPTGCGTWPAFWTNGPNWPLQGEIDIVEGISDYIANQATIHTDTGCTISGDAAQLNMTGALVAQTNCAAYATGNQGCGMRSADDKSFGAAFNANGGGVYAMKWDTTGIAVYFWEPGSVPSDIAAGSLFPDSWGLPMARWPAATCDPFKFFKGHSAIFDTTLCGDWASGAWTSSGLPGQESSCATRTGFSTCEAFVRASGAAFNEAYWEVRSVKIYQTSS